MDKYATETIWGIIGLSLVGLLFFTAGCTKKDVVNRDIQMLQAENHAQTKALIKADRRIRELQEELDLINEAEFVPLEQKDTNDRLDRLEEFNRLHRLQWPELNYPQ